jgi:uncharacterized protein
MTASHRPLHTFILKVASRCNLNCSYCYVYNKGDLTWQHRPPKMSETTFEASLECIRRHCVLSGQKIVTISFHGGEPCLIGAQRFDAWCTSANRVLGVLVDVRFALQTNGTLLDDAWAEVLLKHGVQVGISMDGPQPLHDLFRKDHRGHGSYKAVERGLVLLADKGVPFGILAVIQLGADPIGIHRHFLSLQCDSICYLMPDFTHDTITDIRQRYGSKPCADFLIPVFDDWWFNGTIDTRIKPFWQIAKTILGGDSETDLLGNDPLGYAVIETDGEIEGLDVLRICEEGMPRTGLNVRHADFCDIAWANALNHRAIFEGTLVPQGCRSCPERETCGGGHLPHRYSRARGFDNPSVWCADLLALFTHIRARMGISNGETGQRWRALRSGVPFQSKMRPDTDMAHARVSESSPHGVAVET